MRKPTPVKRLWAAVFRRPEKEAPEMIEARVLVMVDGLGASERLVLRLHYGFDGALTLTEIGRRLERADGRQGVSRQRVQALRARALGRLRHSSRRRAWKEAIEKPAMSR